MAKQNDARTSGAEQKAESSSGETAGNRSNNMTAAEREESGRQKSARSGTTSLSDEASQSGKPEPGGVEGTGGAG